uniref:Uncharacterized protein n=1 Tax=Tanacetum cinerariifolium TaxID=118510 RepID=A0A699GXI2_TANCI|nr:hypothetical protein [Tanacetum cinerariifolium]
MRCTNKELDTLTHNPYVLDLYKKRNNIVSDFLVRSMKDDRNINRFAPSPNTSNLDLGFLPEDARILATSEQGIIVFESPHPHIYYNVVYHVCKPATRQVWSLPNPKTSYLTTKVAIVILGSQPSLRYEILRLSQHKKERSLFVPVGFKSEYNYYVVDDAKNVLRWEFGNKWKLVFPDEVENGKTGSDSLPFKSAFKDVIFHKSGSLAIEKPLGVVQNKLENKDSVIVQFKICCPSIAEGTSILVVFFALQKIYKHITLPGPVFLLQIYVIRNSIELGKWKNGNFSLENGSNREVAVDVLAGGPTYHILSDGMMRKFHEDVGVGEFLDLKLVVDWVVDFGFHLVQL